VWWLLYKTRENIQQHPPEMFSAGTRMIELYISIINVYIIIDYMIIIDVSRSRLWRIVERRR
jgi:hypothetical protein